MLTGEAISCISETHRSSDFIEFLKLLEDKYPEGEKDKAHCRQPYCVYFKGNASISYDKTQPL